MSHIRWMIRRDMPEVLAIESDVFPRPWPEDDFIRCLRQRNCIGMVTVGIDERGQEQSILGYVIYELHKSRLEILNLAVKRSNWRNGIGSKMLRKLKDKLSNQRRNVLAFDVADFNLVGQLFLRANGLGATTIVEGRFHDMIEGGEVDAYRFEWHHSQAVTA